MLKRSRETVLTVLLAGKPPFAAIDTRQSTTMVALLVWAYKRELVRVIDGRMGTSRERLGFRGSATGAACDMLETGVFGSGGGGGALTMPVHPDAEWMHALVRGLDREDYWLIVRAAEGERVPDWNPHIEPLRVTPMLKANGRPRMFVCPVERRAVACRIEVTGTHPDDAALIRERARARYARWHQLLWAMRDKLFEEDALTRWRVVGIGADAKPWATGAAKGC